MLKAHKLFLTLIEIFQVYEVLFNGKGQRLSPRNQVSWIDHAGKDTRDAVKELSELPPSRELELPPTAGVPARRLMEKLGLDIEEVTGLIHPQFKQNSTL